MGEVADWPRLWFFLCSCDRFFVYRVFERVHALLRLCASESADTVLGFLQSIRMHRESAVSLSISCYSI